MEDTPLIEVSCALILNRGRLLATRRSTDMPHALKWEFPGGKLKPGEPARESILREIREELGIGIRILGTLTPVIHVYPTHRVRLHPFICEPDQGEIYLAEHQEYRWVEFGALEALDWLDADVEVLSLFLERQGIQERKARN